MSAIGPDEVLGPLGAGLPGDVVERDRPADARERDAAPATRRSMPTLMNLMTLRVSSRPRRTAYVSG